MAGPIVDLALVTLRDLLKEEAKFLSGVSKEVRGLDTQLKEMRCLLKDADRRQQESNTVKNWIAEIRDLAYRAEDVVERYAVEISSRKRKGFGKLIKRFSCAFRECSLTHQIGSEILKIKSEVERVYDRMDKYGFKGIIQGESSISSAPNENQLRKWQTYPHDQIEDCFVGKEDDLNLLVSLIVDDKKDRVISIWGMGGIGKTTIARKIYNHPKTKRSFKSFAWVCITQQCQSRSVLEEVLKQLLIPQQKTDIMNLSDTELVSRLCEVQTAKRCVIVLDDLWQVDDWDALKPAFLAIGLNNKILLTTRKEDVAAVGFVYKLGLLKADDGWELLKKKAFCRNNVPFPEFTAKENLFKKIGKDMVHKCGYLPLGICLLGGILCNKKSLMEWESVNKNVNAYLYRSEGNKISAVMDLSYEDLPCYLKPCFLYLGRYREDEIIPTIRLYELWIAEGLISCENYGREESLMDIAEIYLRELVSRCIVQVLGLRANKECGSCKLHDLVRELCLSKGKDEDFRLEVMYYQDEKFSTMNPSFIRNKTRFLVIHFSRQEDIKSKDEFTSSNDEINHHNIRSLQFLARCGKKIEFSRNAVDYGKFKLLRVLLFKNCVFEGGKLPTEIGNLICLRQLSFYHCELNELPYSIKNLTRLYTLTLLGMDDVKIPEVLNKMISLRNLIVMSKDPNFPSYYDSDKLENCRLKLEGLEKLECLIGFNSRLHDFKSISKMKNLRALDARVFDNKTLCEILDGCNTNWDKLNIFQLYILGDCELTSADLGLVVLEKVFACTKLTGMLIRVPIRKLQVCNVQSGTQIIFPNLLRLVLSDTEIEDDPMEILEKLPSLDYLQLFGKSYVGEEMICHASGFPKLTTLELMWLLNLREWRIEEGAMPSLHTLKIRSCHNLKTIPDGLKFITTLQKVEIIGMPELGKQFSAMLEDGEEGEDYHKIHHVPFISVS